MTSPVSGLSSDEHPPAPGHRPRARGAGHGAPGTGPGPPLVICNGIGASPATGMPSRPRSVSAVNPLVISAVKSASAGTWRSRPVTVGVMARPRVRRPTWSELSQVGSPWSCAVEQRGEGEAVDPPPRADLDGEGLTQHPEGYAVHGSRAGRGQGEVGGQAEDDGVAAPVGRPRDEGTGGCEVGPAGVDGVGVPGVFVGLPDRLAAVPAADAGHDVRR